MLPRRLRLGVELVFVNLLQAVLTRAYRDVASIQGVGNVSFSTEFIVSPLRTSSRNPYVIYTD